MTTGSVGTPRDAAPGDLFGFAVVVTADRRSDDLAASFGRRGASVHHAPVMRVEPAGRDDVLEAVTRRLLEAPPDDVVVTTAVGFRGWLDAAARLGLRDDLLAALQRARILVRGPKSRGAVRAVGLAEAWCAPSATTAEVFGHLLSGGVRGRRVAVQVHGLPTDDLLDRVEDAGADLEVVRLHRYGPSPDPVAVRRAIDATCAGSVDAVVFTSAPGSTAFLAAAAAAGREAEVLAALRGDTVAAAVGPVTAGPLVAAGIAAVVPERHRLAALVRTLSDHLVSTRVQRITTPAGVLVLRGQAATLDDERLPLSPVPMSLLRTLSRAPGEVVDRHRLLASMPGAKDLHAVEVAVARLRTGIGRPGVVETVVKRGYRLAVADG